MEQAPAATRLDPTVPTFIPKTKVEYIPPHMKLHFHKQAIAAAAALKSQAPTAPAPLVVTKVLDPATPCITGSSITEKSCAKKPISDGSAYGSESGWTNESGNGMIFSLQNLPRRYRDASNFGMGAQIFASSSATHGNSIGQNVTGHSTKHTSEVLESPKTPPPTQLASVKQNEQFELYNAAMAKFAAAHAAKAPSITHAKTSPIPRYASVIRVNNAMPGGVLLPQKPPRVVPYMPPKNQPIAPSVHSEDSLGSFRWAREPDPRCHTPEVFDSIEDYYANRGDISKFKHYIDLPQPYSSEEERRKQEAADNRTQIAKESTRIYPGQTPQEAIYQRAYENSLRKQQGRQYPSQQQQYGQQSRQQQRHQYGQQTRQHQQGSQYNRQGSQQQRGHYQPSHQTRNKQCAPKVPSDDGRDFNGDIMAKGRGFDGNIKHWGVPCQDQDHVGFDKINGIRSDYTSNCTTDSQGNKKKKFVLGPPPPMVYTTYAQLEAARDRDTIEMILRRKAEQEANRHLKPIGRDIANLTPHTTQGERMSKYLRSLNPDAPDAPEDDNLTAEDHPITFPVDPSTIPAPKIYHFPKEIEEDKEDATDLQERPSWMPNNIQRPSTRMASSTPAKQWMKVHGEWKFRAPKPPKYPVGRYRPGGANQWDQVEYSGTLDQIKRQMEAER